MWKPEHRRAAERNALCYPSVNARVAIVKRPDELDRGERNAAAKDVPDLVRQRVRLLLSLLEHHGEDEQLMPPGIGEDSLGELASLRSAIFVLLHDDFEVGIVWVLDEADRTASPMRQWRRSAKPESAS